MLILKPIHIWCSELCKVIAREKGTTPYKTKEWITHKKYPIYKMRKKGFVFIVLHDGKWKNIVGSRVMKGGDMYYNVGGRDDIDANYVNIDGLEIRTIEMKSPEDFGIYSMNDLGEYSVISYKVDESDWQGYCVYTDYSIVTRGLSLEVFYRNRRECVELKEFLSKKI